MRYAQILAVVLLSFLVFDCATDNVSSEPENEEVSDANDQDSNEDSDDDVSNEDDNSENDNPEDSDNQGATVLLVDAFPNLSFDQPLDFQSPSNASNKIYIAEKEGKIKVFDNDSLATEAETFLDLGSISTSSEQGLLGFAFHPNFESNGYFYVCYTPTASAAIISRFTVSLANSNVADLNSELKILEIQQPQTNHNGGQIAFGADGYLYISVGDGGGAGDQDDNAQNKANLLGTILRIDIDNTEQGMNYAIPEDNAFSNEADSRSEIYAFGLRNPWRMSFDTATGKLWAGDVGQGEIEEIDIIVSGGNFGWKLYEGADCYSGACDTTNLIAPIYEYTHSGNGRSITGGYVYRGANNPLLQGKYIYGDFVSGKIWALSEDGSTNDLIIASGLGIASFGIDADQELYVCAFNGKIYRLAQN